MLVINNIFFKKEKPIIINRNDLHIGALINNDNNTFQRKVLCQPQENTVTDILFDSPNYEIEGTDKYSITDLVSLDEFLKFLEYPSQLKKLDLQIIYYLILTSTRVLHIQSEFFGAIPEEKGYKGQIYYAKNLLYKGIETYEDFIRLESILNLSINPTKEEKKDSVKTFRKKIFFIS